MKPKNPPKPTPQPRSHRSKAPAFQFFASDWLLDAELSQCSPESRGIWIDMLCRMWLSPHRGFLMLSEELEAPTLQALSKALRCDLSELSRSIKELEKYRIFSRSKEGIIYSRRMLRIIEEQKRAAKFGKLGGNPYLRGSHSSRPSSPTEIRRAKSKERPPLTPPLTEGEPPSTSTSTSEFNKTPKPPKGGLSGARVMGRRSRGSTEPTSEAQHKAAGGAFG